MNAFSELMMSCRVRRSRLPKEGIIDVWAICCFVLRSMLILGVEYGWLLVVGTGITEGRDAMAATSV